MKSNKKPLPIKLKPIGAGQVAVTLLQAGIACLEKAKDLLEGIGALPCEQQVKALQTAEAIAELAKAMAGVAPPDADQMPLPFEMSGALTIAAEAAAPAPADAPKQPDPPTAPQNRLNLE